MDMGMGMVHGVEMAWSSAWTWRIASCMEWHVTS
jgi:hypothetical protein